MLWVITRLEVENGLSAPVDFVKVIGTFYNKANEVVATDSTYTSPYKIDAGDKAPFDMSVTDADDLPSQIDHYRLVVSHD